MQKADEKDRTALLQLVCPHTPLGTLRFADVPKVLAANASECTVPIEDWDKDAQRRPDDGICKGSFLASFRTNHFIRRCDAAVEDENFCRVCSRMRKSAEGKKVVSGEGDVAYEVIRKAVLSREGVACCIAYWETESQSIVKEGKVTDEFPYFKAKDIVRMILLEGGVILHNVMNKSYKRSRIIVEAQDAHLDSCMQLILQILTKESRKKFLQRWKAVTRTAQTISDQMFDRKDDSAIVGAIQAPDIVREELERAFQQSQKPKATRRFISL